MMSAEPGSFTVTTAMAGVLTLGAA